ncbi:DUF3298 and DUF4163 domain-containing protein [Brevibacillus humidisoli]|uniref:DUF3298 and DUF4163 domain-containing protein n=1 Tax=Brevibacillus humidisoli TaxID=2895522 RepID=UPI001E332AA1|nr:DUF3298 and DUF4163 domain-containing protein [Brevibacillus humidisoli]UFJ39285.1 DUF3298 and DUF4163 domain-containing protein [Brevibacillus humidisoli]
MGDTTIQSTINDLIKTRTRKVKEAFLTDKAAMDQELDPALKSASRYTLDLNYEVKYNQHNWLSIVFYDYVYTGGAHGITNASSYTFSLTDGKLYGLKDLFREGTSYVETINREIKKQIEQKVQDGELYLLSPFASIDEDQEFYLTDDALVIYFQVYEYTPYAAGIPEFSIPMKQLSNMLQVAVNES